MIEIKPEGAPSERSALPPLFGNKPRLAGSGFLGPFSPLKLLIYVNTQEWFRGIIALQQMKVCNMPSNGNGRDPRLIEGVLSGLPLFRQVARSSLGWIASHSQIQYYRRGAAIWRHGERPGAVLAVGYGQVKLSLPRGRREEKVVRFLGASESFGEAPALLDRPSPVDVIALSDSMLALVPARPLQLLLERDPTFARNLVGTLAESLLGLVTEIHVSVQLRSMQRLAAYLASLAAATSDSGACAVTLPVSKTAVAARLGIKKETLSRILRSLADRGVIGVSRREIAILDRDGLERAAQVS